MQRILVTGGAGFIGSAVVRRLVGKGRHVVTLDKLTYAGNLSSLKAVAASPNHRFVQGDIADRALVSNLLREERIEAVMHLAAESHVDRSIDGPAEFVQTNVVGTCGLLDAALEYWRELDMPRREAFRFHHVSTDEVFGDLPFDGSPFSEETPYAPRSPYAASKAASDHFVRAWHATYGFPIVLSNCANNYGPYQFPEKLIPLAVLNALEGKAIPIYGSGLNIRDWIYIDDHAAALEAVLTRGSVGTSYNVGARQERTNLAVVEAICERLDAKVPRGDGRSYSELIAMVADRPGHDRRYAIEPTRIERELGWRPEVGFARGLEMTVDWYLDNQWWWAPIRSGKNAGERVGFG
ncbi:dTDP-glucose 4,6-dehydratase [Altererythrobacter arenosus]|uniref:dTDP-glucose 4,6-dehydratase n=1 Tax=Altererythrobacter arenosus TaxID=3032592 RepID=A0ABY8FUR3_9SPHN|nr:dTDP-glucose 4,6-dehydratase [Altererythrobacter sp. CAU 1644]WFL78743.1 dTDP-glucose 4,6-dehydratase [Altererythrobacter sp. CAU 1644]